MAEVIVEELHDAADSFDVTIYLFDRFGRMQPIDYVQFFEEFAARTRGLKALEGRLAQYSGALPRTEVKNALLSAVNPRPSQAVSVFVSYAHADERWRKELGKHLSVLERQGLIATWHDRMIGAGTEWKGAIDAHLNEARVILLLISADFIHSDYCYDLEMKRALERHRERSALVVPVMIRAVSLEGTPFAELQGLPKDAQPVATWTDHDSAFVDITDGLRNAIHDLVGAG